MLEYLTKDSRSGSSNCPAIYFWASTPAPALAMFALQGKIPDPDDYPELRLLTADEASVALPIETVMRGLAMHLQRRTPPRQSWLSRTHGMNIGSLRLLATGFGGDDRPQFLAVGKRLGSTLRAQLRDVAPDERAVLVPVETVIARTTACRLEGNGVSPWLGHLTRNTNLDQLPQLVPAQ